MDPFLFKQTIFSLEYPLLSNDDLLEIFKLYLNKLKSVLDNNITDAILYYYSAFQEILEFKKLNENKEEQLFELVKIVDKYFTVTSTNALFLQSTYVIVQAFMKATVHQIWQCNFTLFKNRNMKIEDIDDAINLYNEYIIDVIFAAKKAE